MPLTYALRRRWPEATDEEIARGLIWPSPWRRPSRRPDPASRAANGRFHAHWKPVFCAADIPPVGEPYTTVSLALAAPKMLLASERTERDASASEASAFILVFFPRCTDNAGDVGLSLLFVFYEGNSRRRRSGISTASSPRSTNSSSSSIAVSAPKKKVSSAEASNSDFTRFPHFNRLKAFSFSLQIWVDLIIRPGRRDT